MAEHRLGEPTERFHAWFEEAKRKESDLPEAMSVATVGENGRPATRMVLLKDADERGFVFYTNLESRKGLEIKANPFAALLFHWKSLKRQVRIEGRIEEVSAEDADAYFASRARGAQIGAWASAQSRPLEGSFELEKRVAQYTAKFGIGRIERPAFWTGLRVVPDRLEFWTEGSFRLHDRLVYVRDGDGWRTERLFP